MSIDLDDWVFVEPILENTMPTLQLKMFAMFQAGNARAKRTTDLRAFCDTVRAAVDFRGAKAGGPILTSVVLSDLQRVLIGDGWTDKQRNHGPFALQANSFLDSGFRKAFQDGGNQVQHAMAGIFIRYIFGRAVSWYVKHSEDEEADRALYNASFDVGGELARTDDVAVLPQHILMSLT
jgi:hypothetical protein